MDTDSTTTQDLRAAMMIRADARSVGMVTATEVRVTPRWSATFDRCVGTALGVFGEPVFLTGDADDPASSTHGARSVRCYNLNDPLGTLTFRTAASFRRLRTQRRQERRAQMQRKLMAMDLPPVFAD